MSFVVRFAGRLAELSLTDRTVLLARSRAEVDDSIESQVRELARSIRADGDAGVRAATERFDGIKLETLRVPDEVVRAALQQAPRNVVAALERSAANLERVHRAFLPPTVEIETEPGVIVGRRPEPLGAVGVYAPGGRAAYPSSVLMGVVPARVAGVGRIVVCSPPQPGGLDRKSVV